MNEELDLRVLKIHHLPEGRIKAFVDLIVNDGILIKGIRVVSSPKGGIFVSMPQVEGKNNRWYERVRCLKPKVREYMNDVILESYAASLNRPS